ncbi:VOC family protein [Mucilaginibacter aquaedulcis]|uniref:VOC family protein n=1 Tax=Mucilaginibacter aquaedulcis TaxID=1187081 RepID=UPI0025B377B1|nr:VOC family protein [Mucilaginibacter aquaedulcis]MDN3550719.1 VOC family protein [Mucilaginibacter aquaedulcis]
MANEPTYGNGKICYIEIPATDVAVSAAFFQKVFGWQIRSDNAGNTSFDDGVGQVSGTWVIGPKPMITAGFVISIMVDDANAAVGLIKANGGVIIKPVDENASEITAHFTDPAGNLWGIYQHGG